MGEDRQTRNTSVGPNFHNGQTGLGQTSTHSSSVTNRTGAKSPHRGNQNAQNSVQGGTQGAQSSSSPQCFRCQGWGHMARECATPAAPVKQGRGNPRECGQTPLQSSTVSSKHSLCDPEAKTNPG